MRRPEPKDLRLLSGVHAIGCPSQIGGLYVIPLLAQIDPRGIHLLNQADLLFAPPSLYLLFTGNGLRYILIPFEPDKSVAVISFREAVVLPPFVLEDAFAEVSRDADVESVAAADHDVRKYARSSMVRMVLE